MSMKAFTSLRFAGIVAVVATSLALSVDRLAAQSRPAVHQWFAENVIEPYNGAPIYLDEPRSYRRTDDRPSRNDSTGKVPGWDGACRASGGLFLRQSLRGRRHLPRIPPQWKAVHRRSISTGPAARRMDVLLRRREGQPQGDSITTASPTARGMSSGSTAPSRPNGVSKAASETASGSPTTKPARSRSAKSTM